MRSRVWMFVAVLSGIFLISACGGGGGGSSNLPAPQQDPQQLQIEVVSTTPATGALQVAVDSDISVLFSEDIDPSTVNAATFIVAGLDGAKVPGTFMVTENTVTFTPVSSLDFDMTYETTLTTDIADLNGARLGEEYYWSFITASPPDEAQLSFKVVSTIPADYEIQVPVDSSISVLFSRAIDPATVNVETFIVIDWDEVEVPGTFAVTERTVTFTPSIDLEYDTDYEVILTTNIADVDGTSLENEYYWSFTTASPPDTTPPTIVFFSPEDGATGVPTNSIVAVTFSEPIDPASITDGVFILYDDSDGEVPGQVFYNDLSIVFVPMNDLAGNAVFYAELAEGITDLAGNAAEGFSWSFSTGIDRDESGPTVLTVNPVPGAFVLPGQTISATFSEAVNPNSVNGDTFIVRKGDGVPVPGTLTTNGATVMFTPAELGYKETYTVTLSDIEDMARNAMAEPYEWSFSTGMGVVKVIPRIDQKNVALNQPVIVTFSEPVDPATITNETFLVTRGETAVNGALTIDGAMVTFVPTTIYAGKTTYEVTLTKGIRDLSEDNMPLPDDYIWNFSTHKKRLLRK